MAGHKKQQTPEHTGHRKRLRDRYFSAGTEAFAPHEVVELLLTLALPRGDVKPLAKRLLARFGTIRSIKEALKRNAYAIAFAHNHPGGDPSPSDPDKLLTKQLVLAATAVNIKVVDHLIIASAGTFSFRQSGLL